jgi:hypothetical protein
MFHLNVKYRSHDGGRSGEAAMEYAGTGGAGTRCVWCKPARLGDRCHRAGVLAGGRIRSSTSDAFIRTVHIVIRRDDLPMRLGGIRLRLTSLALEPLRHDSCDVLFSALIRTN